MQEIPKKLGCWGSNTWNGGRAWPFRNTPLLYVTMAILGQTKWVCMGLVLKFTMRMRATTSPAGAPDSEFWFIEIGMLKFYDWLIDWLIQSKNFCGTDCEPGRRHPRWWVLNNHTRGIPDHQFPINYTTFIGFRWGSKVVCFRALPSSGVLGWELRIFVC